MPQSQIPEDFNFNSFGGTPESQEIEDTDTPIRENSADIDYQEEREITNNPDTAFVKEELQEMQDINEEVNGGVWDDIKTGLVRLPQNITGGILKSANELWKFTHVNDGLQYIEQRLEEYMPPEAEEDRPDDAFQPSGPLRRVMNGEGPLPTIEAQSTTGEVIQGGSQFPYRPRCNSIPFGSVIR